jgi:predicted Zn-dependent protease
MDYVRRITELLFILAIAFFLYIFWPDLQSGYNRLFFNPCKNPIQYHIGTIDSGFGVSKDFLLSAVKEAEDSWETVSKTNLFNYSEGKGVKVSLIYDYRQNTTKEIDELGKVLDIDESYYSKLKSEYDRYVSEYEKSSADLNSLVSSYNQSGYKKKNAEQLLNEIKEKEADNAVLVEKINNLAKEINSLAEKYNLNAGTYNDLGKSFEEFEQGNYTADSYSRAINIYQFDNREKLVSVLIHEMGHALEISHADNPQDIMYSVNAGESQNITEWDLSQLNAVCSRNSLVFLMENVKKAFSF